MRTSTLEMRTDRRNDGRQDRSVEAGRGTLLLWDLVVKVLPCEGVGVLVMDLPLRLCLLTTG